MLRILHTTPLLMALLLSACASPGPEFTAWRKELASSSSRPTPNIRPPTQIGGPREWQTYDGADAGTEGGGMRVFDQGFQHYRIRVGILMRLTDKNYWVGCEGKDPICVIRIPSSDGSYRSFERYGPTLRSVRGPKAWEQQMIKAGGDILYVTGEGVFRASQLTD